jgi:exodeoxyribonuclease VIII
MNYYERPELSNSAIKLINKSYSHYLGAKFLKTTPAMDVGSAFHCYILENDEFHERYIIKTAEMEFRTKEMKAFRDDQIAKGKVFIQEDDYKWFGKMYANLENHRLFSLIQGELEIEKEIYFDYLGVDCKAKVDLINHSNKMIFDFKSITDCALAENRARFDYAPQGYFYQVGAVKVFGSDYTFVLVFCEKNYPNEVKFIAYNPETLDYGREFIHKGIERYKYLQANRDCYKGYSDDFIWV